jgi:hypothetical protein
MVSVDSDAMWKVPVGSQPLARTRFSASLRITYSVRS